MTYYIVHYMNNYRNLHDILHEITCHSMELVECKNKITYAQDSNQRPLAYQTSGLTATLLVHREDIGNVETRYMYILVANIFQYDALHDITLYYMSVTCHITWQVTRKIT